MSTPHSTMSSFRHSVTQRRVNRRDRRRLESELASYTSASDRRELDAILSRHTADETRDVEAILFRQAETRTAHGSSAKR